MRDEINTKVEYIRPLTNLLMTIGELPTSYLMSLTYEEQLLWFYNFLNEKIIPTINTSSKAVQELQELFVLLQKYVNDYFDNLDVQEEINNKLDQMVEDGTFAELIKEYLRNSDSNVITMNRKYRFLFESGKYLDNLDENDTYYGFIQGGTYTENGRFVVACMASDENHETNNMVKLREFNADGTLSRELELELNHANSMAYNSKDKLLYVVSGSKFVNGESTPDNTLFVINYNNFSLVGSYLYAEQISGVGYDNIKDKLYVGYVGNYIYELNEEYEIINTITLETPEEVASAGKQSFTVNNDIIYACYIRPDMIISYYLDGKLDRIYSVPKYGNGGTMYVGEIEDLSFYNGKMYSFSSALTTYYSQLYQLNIFELDLIHNVLDNPLWFAERGFLANNINSVFVDSSNTNPNPTGSTTNPFKEIFEAISYLSGSRYGGAGRIHVRAGTYRNIFLFNNNIELDESGTGTINIGGIYAISSKLNLQQCTVNKTNSGLTNPIQLKNSEITFTNLTLGAFTQYGIFSEQSKIYYRGNEIVTETLESNQFAIYLDAGSSLEMGQGLGGYNNIYYASLSSYINPNIVHLAYLLNKHYGDITLNKQKYCLDNALFKFIAFKCKVNGIDKIFKFPTNLTTFNIEDTYMGNATQKMCLNKMVIEKTETGLTISSNQWARYTGEAGDTWTITNKDNNTINNSFMILEDIYLTNIP